MEKHEKEEDIFVNGTNLGTSTLKVLVTNLIDTQTQTFPFSFLEILL